MKQTRPVPLALPALLWMIGLFLAELFFIPFIYCFAAFAVIIVFFFIRKLKLFALMAGIIIIAFLRFEIQDKLPVNHVSNIIAQYNPIQQPITGEIISEIKENDGKYSFILALEAITEIPIAGKMKFSTRQENLRFGDKISTIAKIKKLSKPTNPYAFDYENTMRRKQIFASGYSLSPIKIQVRSKWSLQNYIIAVRMWFKKTIDQRFVKFAGFVKAIIVGDKTEIEASRILLSKAGLSHILAVSGLHVGVLSLVLMQILFIFIPQRNLARIILILVLLFYGAICNWSASVFRAVIMINLFLLSRIFQRKINTNNLLAASFIIITAIEPNQLFSAGFQMSFLAVFTLLNILPRVRFISLNKEDIKALSFSKKLINSLLVIMLSSFILNIVLAPVTMFHFQQFGFNGIIGNTLGIPLIGIILPIAFLIIFLPNIAWLISIYFSCFQLVMQIFEKWANFAATLPLHFDFVSIDLIQLILLYAAIIFIITLFKNKKNNKIIFTFLLICSIGLFISLRNTDNSKLLKLTFFDCGLGDLILLETPENETIMIDTGPPEKNFGSFQNSALPYFKTSGINKLNWLIITHAHNDHYGGFKKVFSELEVANFAVSDEFCERKIWPVFAKLIEEEQCKLYCITDTVTIINNCLKLLLLHPDSSFSDDNINNLSIVTRLEYGKFTVLLTGDLEHEGEHHLLQNYYDYLDCDILKVGHHGSKTASSMEFLEAVIPHVSIISTSLQNRFNFPHAKAIENLGSIETNLYITGRDGAIQIESDGSTAKFTTFLTKESFIISLDE